MPYIFNKQMKRISSNNNNLYTQLYTAKTPNSAYIPQTPKPNPSLIPSSNLDKK
jgi:hypothetical protein